MEDFEGVVGDGSLELRGRANSNGKKTRNGCRKKGFTGTGPNGELILDH